MVSKTKRIFVFLILSAVGMGAFQNCSKTNFKTNDELQQASLTGPVDPTTGFAPIFVDGNAGSSSQGAIKFFLVIDTSHSMINELNKVKVALSAFIDEQRTRQAFDIYLYPIYDLTDSDYNLRPPLAEMKLRNDGNFDNAKAQFMSKFQQQIDGIRMNDIAETGMCQVARILKDKKLFNSQDDVAFVVVTDEDDSSLEEGYCVESVGQITIDSRIQLEADYVQTLAKGRFSGLVKVDAGGTAPFIREPFAIAPGCSEYGCIPGVYACSTDIINNIKNSYYMTDKGQVHSVSSVDECEVTISNSRIGFGGMIVKDTKTLSGLALKQSDINGIIAGTQGFKYNGKSYNDIANYALIEFPQWSKNVTAQFIAESYKPDNRQMAEFHNKTATQSNKAVMDLIKKQIPDSNNVAVDFVIFNPALNPVGVTCGPQDSGVIGKRYLDFVNQSGRPQLFKAESICQSNYSSPLLHAASLTVEWSAVRDYILSGANAAQINLIKSVKIVSAQGNLLKVLKSDEYSLDFNKRMLTIAPSVELPQGSQIVLLP